MSDAADLGALPPIDTQLGSDPGLLLAEIKAIIASAIEAHPRSQQTRLGPSEIGDPCARRLAYKLLGTQKARTLSTPWRPTVGTAVHSWIEEAIAAHNEAVRLKPDYAGAYYNLGIDYLMSGDKKKAAEQAKKAAKKAAESARP